MTGDKHAIVYNIFFSLGIAVFSSLSIQKFFQKEAVNLMLDSVPLLGDLNKFGVNKVLDENKLSFIPDYKTSPHLFIVMNDGKNFTTNNSSELCERLKSPNISTTFILLDPEAEASVWLSSANDKEGQAFYKDKISDSIRTIKGFSKNHSHMVEVFLYGKGYFRTSIVLSDKYAIIGGYRNSPGKRGLPLHFLISDSGSYYKFIKEDVECLKELSKIS